MQSVFFFEETRLLDGAYEGLLVSKHSVDKIAECRMQQADVAHIQLDGRMHNLLVVCITNFISVS